jgi:hypothetical protein
MRAILDARHFCARENAGKNIPCRVEYTEIALKKEKT